MGTMVTCDLPTAVLLPSEAVHCIETLVGGSSAVLK